MNKIEKLFLYITSTLFFLSIFLMGFSSVCHAEEGGALPYVIPLYRDYNSFIPDAALDSAISYYYANIPSNVTVNSFIAYTWDYPDVNGISYRIYFLTNPSVIEGVSPSINYLENGIRVNSNDYSITYVTVRKSDFVSTGFAYNVGSWTYLLGDQPLVTQSNGFTTRKGYPLVMSGVNNLYSNRIDGGDPLLVFTNTVPYSPDIPGVGHATQPGNDPNNFINGSNGQPVTRPTSPTINNYTWNTWSSPTIDTSSVESLLESLIDVVTSLISWLGSNISGEFTNLLSNLHNLFDFLVQGIENGFNKVISAIQDLATDLYNNFVSLFEPITQQLSYITASIDTDLIQGEVESTSIMSDYSEVVSIKDSFVSVFTDTSEPSSFTIPIHLENLSMLNVGTQYIDLSVINPVKSALRTFIWVIVSFGLVVTIIDSIPNYINGGGDE